MKIKHIGLVKDHTYFDYELEDGMLLHQSEWNGEAYYVKQPKGSPYYPEKIYKPVYRYQLEGMDLDAIEENSEEWEKALEIVEFEEKF